MWHEQTLSVEVPTKQKKTETQGGMPACREFHLDYGISSVYIRIPRKPYSSGWEQGRIVEFTNDK